MAAAQGRGARDDIFSLIRCSREVLPHLRTAGGAGNSFTKTLALEVAKDNILVNGVNIGFVITPQWENIHRRRAPELSSDEFFDRLAAQEVPLGRFGLLDEVSGLVSFLLSDRATYITGASIDVAGGMGKYV